MSLLSNPTIKRAVSVRTHSSNVCTDASATNAMDDYDGPHPSSGEEVWLWFDSSLQTQPPTPPMRDTCPGSDSHSPRSADIPPDTAPRLFQSRDPPTTTGARCWQPKSMLSSDGNYPDVPNTGRYLDAYAPSTKRQHGGIPKENLQWGYSFGRFLLRRWVYNYYLILLKF